MKHMALEVCTKGQSRSFHAILECVDTGCLWVVSARCRHWEAAWEHASPCIRAAGFRQEGVGRDQCSHPGRHGHSARSAGAGH